MSKSTRHDLLPAPKRIAPIHATSYRWAAVRSRDSSANSAFLYGVTSTHIFCRPTCPARVARRSNIIYFDDIPAALHAGYRPCKRCEPCNASWHRDMQSRLSFEQACKYITDAVAAEEHWTIVGIAERVGVSSCHLHRLFKKYANTTPKEFGNTRAISQLTETPDQRSCQSVVAVSLDEPLVDIDATNLNEAPDALFWSTWDDRPGGFDAAYAGCSSETLSSWLYLDEASPCTNTVHPLMTYDLDTAQTIHFE